jgi:prepilin-type N-terminal cleavage/methylation domain-containing protein
MTHIPRHRRAFTLVEIMIVVLIIGILLAIAAPQYANARTQAQQATCLDNLRQILTAKEQWGFELKQSSGATPVSTDLVPQYMKSFPSCPSSGTYAIGSLSVAPSCTVSGHTIP